MNKGQKKPSAGRNIQHLQANKKVKASDDGSIEKIKKEKTPKSHSRKNAPPEELRELIRMVRLMPPGVATHTSKEFGDIAKSVRAKHPIAVERDESQYKFVKQAIGKLPKPLREYAGKYLDSDPATGGQWLSYDPQTFEIFSYIDPYEPYDHLVIGRELLQEIARNGLSWKAREMLRAPMRLTKNSSGRIELEPSLLSKSFLGAEFSRIRECPVCQKIFWAERKDLKACPGDCVRSLRNSRYHKSYLEKYKLQRIQKADEADKKHSKKGK